MWEGGNNKCSFTYAECLCNIKMEISSYLEFRKDFRVRVIDLRNGSYRFEIDGKRGQGR